MRVPQSGGDVELEVTAVLNDVVTEPDVLHVVLAEALSEEDGLQDGVQLLPHILHQTRVTKLKCLTYTYLLW